MTDTETVNKVAEAMRAKREELIARPLASIWPDLARAAISAMQGWRPIDEAPKDGTKLLVYSPEDEYPVIAHWEAYDQEDAQEYGADGYWSYSESLIADVYGECTPTHFMPLPLPPEGE